MATTVIGLFREACTRFPDRPFLAWRPAPKSPFVHLTYAQVAEQVDHLASWLLKQGLPGKKVLLVSDTTREWLVADFACQAIGAVSVPRSATVADRELHVILKHSGAVAAIVQHEGAFQKLPISFARKHPILAFQGFRGLPRHGATFADVISRQWADLGKVRALERRVDGDTLVTLVYTSGTTGDPKGVMLTHRNFMHNARHLPQVLELRSHEIYLALLPLWHAYERTCEYLTMGIGATLHYTTSRHLKEDMRSVRPTIFPSAPAVWINVHRAFMDQIHRKPLPLRWLLNALIHGSLVHTRAMRRIRGTACQRGRETPPVRVVDRLAAAMLSPVRRLASGLIFSKLKQATGGRLERAVSGGGALPEAVDDFFETAGLPLLNGYGLTETGPVISVRLPRENIRGTIGPVLPEITLRIADPDTGRVLPRGEIGFIQVQGPNVMTGYYRNPKATQAAFLTDSTLVDGRRRTKPRKPFPSKDAFFHTGDLGYLDNRGHLVFTGRRKEVLVLSSGENIWPHAVEEALLRSPDIHQCMLVGQDRKVPAMLIVPNLERLLAWAERQDLHHLDTHELLGHPSVHAHFQDLIHTFVNENHDRIQPHERVGHFTLLEKPFTEGDELTQTLKMRREVITSKYGHVIDRMYGLPRGTGS